MPTAIAIVSIPTIIWCLIYIWVQNSRHWFHWLIAGVSLGAALGIPAWFLETAIGQFAVGEGRFLQDFMEQVVGAAFCEEVLKFLAIGLLVWISSRQAPNNVRQIVGISIAVGIGFMTLENLLGIFRSADPISLALDRQVALFVGHPSYQVIMGYLLAIAIQRRSVTWLLAALLVPLTLHGWGDLSEKLFQDEINPGSLEDTVLFSSWLASLVVTTSMAGALLWFTLRARQDRAPTACEETACKESIN